MALKAVFKLTVPIFVIWNISYCQGRTVTLSHGIWNGNVGYMAVDREAVQEKLDFYNTHIVSPGGTQLFLPRNSVFPSILNETQHVLYFDFGTMTVFECDKSVSVSRPASSTAIPLLAADPDGIPKYSLALHIFHERSRVDVPNVNMVFPYTPVDEVTLDDNGVTIKDSDEEIRISVERNEDSCKPNPPAVRNELEEFLNKESLFGNLGPDFSYCDDFPNHHYCSIVDSIRGEVQHWGSNVCQMGWGAPVAGSCQLSSSIVTITPGFRELWLLGSNDPVNVIAFESYNQEFDVIVKFPCL